MRLLSFAQPLPESGGQVDVSAVRSPEHPATAITYAAASAKEQKPGAPLGANWPFGLLEQRLTICRVLRLTDRAGRVIGLCTSKGRTLDGVVEIAVAERRCPASAPQGVGVAPAC